MVNTRADQAQGNKSQSAANAVSQMKAGDDPAFQFADNRREAAAQRKLQEMANNSPQVSQLSAFQAMANNSPRARQTAQLQPIADNSPAKFQQPIQKKENNTGLPDNLKSGIENLSGFSMNDVRVHHNSDKPAQLQAHAYAQGTEIHLASGQEKHLPHEAWHVVQQKQGRVKPTMQMKGKVDVNDDAGLEKEADVIGAKAMGFIGSGPVSEKSSGQFLSLPTVQRVKVEESNAAGINGVLAKYVDNRTPLAGATAGASGSVELAQAKAPLVEVSHEILLVEEGDNVVVKKVVVPSMDRIRTEDDDEERTVPLEGLMPEKLNDDGNDNATATWVTIQEIKDEVIKSYYLIMEYAAGGDQAHKKVKKSEINDFNADAKTYYRKLEVIFTQLAKSGYNSGDIKPANIFLNSAGLPMLGDFGDYTVGEYRRKNEDITDLMNDLMKASNVKKSYSEIQAWAAGVSLWVPAPVTTMPAVEIPVLRATEEAVQEAVVASDTESV